MDSFQVPYDFVDYSHIADSRSISVCMPFQLLYVVVFGWNRVFTENHEKFNNSAFMVFRKFFYSLSGFLRGYDLKQVTNLAV